MALYNSVASSRSLNSNDFDKVLVCDSASVITITVNADNLIGTTTPQNVVVALYMAGAGVPAFAAGTGVTIRGTAPTLAQYGTMGIMRVGANEWAYIQ